MRIRTFATVVIAAAAIFGFAAPAFAHDQLVSTTPEAGSVVATSPEKVTLSFNENVLDIGNAIVVQDAAGTDWTTGDVTINDGTVSKTLQPALPEGMYTVEWRVVSADGHPVSGSYVFGVGSSADLQDQVTAAQAGIVQPADDDADATATATADATAYTSGAPADNVWLTVGIAVGGALLAIALFWSTITIIRKRQQ